MPSLKEFTCLTGHKDMITSITLTDDSSTLFLSSSRDKKVLAWSPSEDFASVKKAYEDSRHYVNSVCGSKLGFIVAGGADKLCRIYPTNKRLLHNKEITCVTINSDNNKIICGSMDGGIYLWNTEGVLINEFKVKEEAWVTCCAFIPGKEILVAGYADGALRVWDIDSGEVINTFYKGKKEKVSCQGITSLSITPDGACCAYGGKDSCVYIVDLAKGDVIKELNTESNITALAFALTETIIAVATRENIMLWDVFSGKMLTRISSTELEAWCSSLAWVKNYLMVGTNKGFIKGFEFSNE